MRPITFLLLLLISSYAFSETAGVLKKNCKCRGWMFGEESTSFEGIKGDNIGLECDESKDEIRCSPMYATSIACPKECVEIVQKSKITSSEIANAYDAAYPKAMEQYSQVVNAELLEELKKQFPNWWPYLYDEARVFSQNSDFEISIKLIWDDYFIPLDGFSVIFFFKDKDRAMKGEGSWGVFSEKGLIVEDLPFRVFRDPESPYHVAHSLNKEEPPGSNIISFFDAGPSDTGDDFAKFHVSSKGFKPLN